jgi:transposase
VRVIGLDVHRSFAIAVFLDGDGMHNGGRVELTRDAVITFGRQLRPDDEVVIEATVNTVGIVRLLEPFVHRLVIANPLQVRAIAHAKIKTDKIDAAVLAKLHASGFLPEVWMPDEATETLRRLVAQRTQVVQQMTRMRQAPFGAAREPDPTLRGRVVQPDRPGLAGNSAAGCR